MSFWMVPLSWSWLDALLLAGDDEAGQHREHGAVHRHRHRHLLEGDAVEEDLHVLDGVDRHAGLADVADDARVVGVVAAVGGQVEGHRHALLAGGQVAPVEGVRLLGGGEPGVLADRPRPARVHRGAHPAHERRATRGCVSTCSSAVEVGRGVQRLHDDALGGLPHQRVGVGALEVLGGERPPGLGAHWVGHRPEDRGVRRRGRTAARSAPPRSRSLDRTMWSRCRSRTAPARHRPS